MNDSIRRLRLSSRAIAMIVAVAFLAAGCTAFQRDKRPACPGISVLAESGSITLFKPGPGRDLIDVTNTGEVVGIKLSCGDFSPDGVDAVATVDLLLRRGPASNPDEASEVEVPYFVAVVDRTGAIRDKAVFRTVIDFPPGAQVNGVREEVDVKISTAGGQSLVDSGVMVGFQLSPEQYDYNRRQSRQ
jgi:hypothetical protein